MGVNEKTGWKQLLIFLGIPVAAGLLSALVSMDGMKRFADVPQPPLTPPGWLFPVVWSILYLMMGYASYVAWRSDTPKQQVQNALRWYGAQLAANFWWSPLFFQWGMYLPALLWLILMLVLIVVVLVKFWHIDRKAGMLMLPYLCWVLFAGYLNAGVWVLSKTV